MKIMRREIFIIVCLFGALLIQSGCKTNSNDKSESEEWKAIAEYFSPPEEFANNYGNYRSPLRFYNGDSVKTTQDWKKRRNEILVRWHEIMGQWPELITNQQMEYLDTIKKENFIQYKVRFSYIPGVKTEGYLLVPEEEGVFPAVITVYYEPETGAGNGKPSLKYRDYAYQLVKRGFVTLSIGSTNFYYPSMDSVIIEPLSLMAYAAANAWNVLAKVDEVDSTRIGIVGHSYGGKWAMFASCLYDKFACAAWSDGGIVFDESRANVNYWEPWYLGYHPKPWRNEGVVTEDNPAGGAYQELVKNGLDLTDLHALMAPRPFLVSGGAEDPPERWVALNHAIAVNKLLGFTDRVAMTNREKHSPNEESNEQIFRFFEYFLN